MVTDTSSTFQNWCWRIMPRVSRPALPASERKHGVCAVSRMGSCAASRICPRTVLVSGISLVAIRYCSACGAAPGSAASAPRVTQNMSCRNLGSCPVPSRISPLTM